MIKTREQKHCLTAIIRDKKNNIIAIGKNSYFKTHTLMYKLQRNQGVQNPKKLFIHAEVDAIVKCINIENAHSIEVFRIGKSNKYLTSKPCSICMEAIKTLTNIKIIKYMNSKSEVIIEKVKH